MKKFLILITFFLISINSHSQNINLGDYGKKIAQLPKMTLLDVSLLECVYQLDSYDSDLEERRESFAILQYGDSVAKYVDYGTYRQDSVYFKCDRSKFLVKDLVDVYNRYHKSTSFFLIHDLKSDTMRVFDKVFIDNYRYIEPAPNFAWTFSDETKTVCGYQCRKAACDFRGRHWTAWYAEEIPVSSGPWKLGGLPGLILAAEDSTGELSFTAVTIRNAENDITFNEGLYTRTTREKLNKAMKEYTDNPGKIISSSIAAPKDMNGKKVEISKQKWFYVPFEKE